MHPTKVVFNVYYFYKQFLQLQKNDARQKGEASLAISYSNLIRFLNNEQIKELKLKVLNIIQNDYIQQY